MAHCRIEPGAELCCDVHCMAFKGLSLWSAVLHKRFYESASSLSYIPVHRRACRAFHMGIQNKKSSKGSTLKRAAVTNILSFLKNIFSGRTKIRVTVF